MKASVLALVCCVAVLAHVQGKGEEDNDDKSIRILLKELLKRGAINNLKNETVNNEEADVDEDKRSMATSVYCNSFEVERGRVSMYFHENQWQTDTVCYQHGLYKSGDKHRVCQSDGTWSGTPVVCIENTCNPRKDFNSWSLCSQYIRDCIPGGQHTVEYMQKYCFRSCCEDALRKEQLAMCAAPPNVPLGVTTGSDFYQHAKISVRCNSGLYHVSGDLERTCLTSGRWSGTTPVCKDVNCGLPSGTEGTVVGTDFRPHKTVSFKCNSDKVIVSGDKKRTCGLNGQWSGTAPVCRYVNCGLPAGTGGTVKGTDFTALKKVSFRCDSEKVRVSGNIVRTCGLNGQWSGTAPVCQAHACLTTTKPDQHFFCPVLVGSNCGPNDGVRRICERTCCLRNAGIKPE